MLGSGRFLVIDFCYGVCCWNYGWVLLLLLLVKLFLSFGGFNLTEFISGRWSILYSDFQELSFMETIISPYFGFQDNNPFIQESSCMGQGSMVTCY